MTTEQKPPNSDGSNVDQYIAELREGGEDVPASQFTLDRERAREKLASLRLSEPHQYVTELIQAAVAAGATRVNVDIDADDVRVRFDGRGFTREDFELLYDPGEVGADESAVEARKQLGLGLSLALALDPKFIRVASSGPRGAAELELVPGQPDRYDTVESTRSETTIHLRRRASLKLVSKAAQNVMGTLPEKQLIRERCRFSPVEIILDGQSVVQPQALPEEPLRVTRERAGRELVAGFMPMDPTRSVLHIVQWGVLIDTVELKLRPPHGFVAVAWTHSLKRDLSLRKVLRDDALEAWTKLAERAFLAALEKVRDKLRDAEALEQQPVWLLRVLRLAVSHKTLKRTGSLEQLHLWPVVTQKSQRKAMSLEAIRARCRRKGPIDVVLEDESRLQDAQIRAWVPLCLVLADDKERKALAMNHDLTLIPVEEDAAKGAASLAAGSRRWSWLTKLRFLKWPAIVVGSVLAVVLVYSMFNMPSDDLDDPAESSAPTNHKECKGGDAAACVKHARSLVMAGAAKGYVEASKAFARACSYGDRRGCREAHNLESQAKVHTSDRARSHVLLSRACSWGELKACYSAAELFASLPPDVRKKIQRVDVQQCEKHRRRLSCFRAGVRAQVGFGVKAMPHTARMRLKGCCKERLVVACAFTDSDVGQDHSSAAPENWAGRYLKLACRAKNAQACSNLSVLVLYGRGVAKNEAYALTLARSGCDGGHALACRRVGNLLGAKKGSKHALETHRIYERGCKLGDASSCNYASEGYWGAKPLIRKDLKKAAELHRSSCKLKNGLGCFNLGLYYRRGMGVSKNLALARKYYGEACNYGYSDGCWERDEIPSDVRPPPKKK